MTPGPASPGPVDDHNVPVVVSSEMDTLLSFLGYLRAAVDRKIAQLSEEDARRALVPSGTTVLGIVKHLAVVEVYWAQRRFAGLDVGSGQDGFELDAGDTVDSARRAYAEAGRRTDEIASGCPDLSTPLARSRQGLTLRWMLDHLVEETARHAGHLDILRELIDGHTGR
jgi:uncharacterized damage-inducible protein DinB